MKENLIQNAVNFVKEKLEGAEAGHDWFHIERVWKLSKKIAAEENCNLQIVELAALLHDIADPKFHNGDETLALKISREFLENENVSEEIIQPVLFIIKNIPLAIIFKLSYLLSIARFYFLVKNVTMN